MAIESADEDTLFDESILSEFTEDGSDVRCEHCGTTIPYSGHGRKKKFCEEHNTPAKRGTQSEPGKEAAPRRAKGLAELEKNLYEQFVMLGTVTMFFDQFDGQIIVKNAQGAAKALTGLAATNPKLRKALEGGASISSWVPVLMVGFQIGAPIAAHHGLIRGVQDPAKLMKPRSNEDDPMASFFNSKADQ